MSVGTSPSSIDSGRLHHGQAEVGRKVNQQIGRLEHFGGQHRAREERPERVEIDSGASENVTSEEFALR